MNGKQLKQWVANIPDEAIIEVKRYDWETIDLKNLRAIFICQPDRTLDDVCNAEQVSS